MVFAIGVGVGLIVAAILIMEVRGSEWFLMWQINRERRKKWSGTTKYINSFKVKR